MPEILLDAILLAAQASLAWLSYNNRCRTIFPSHRKKTSEQTESLFLRPPNLITPSLLAEDIPGLRLYLDGVWYDRTLVWAVRYYYVVEDQHTWGPGRRWRQDVFLLEDGKLNKLKKSFRQTF
ncbi:hypothetical protein HRR81_001222 [Exophiala dermatitidis]|nr:hypothetical protein HRR74_004044 [Exophiala dermatitidis]KAJ4529119.1 hypothetical protein HRR73_000139 [Exophiala dermatitidis]KAJ4538519.1 hypothetical protein HRR77_007002 [Exophiala dermatitidis]KAJ4582496.1 hypothetical protein HRR81_001222 [Exophiala dermatitidis]KAJ4637425.1 hypothetical protein HRR89_006659 [Exophiala dermatitidis]